MEEELENLGVEELIDEFGADPCAWTECWGAELTGVMCTRGFKRDPSAAGHLKNKFCGRCRSLGLEVAQERVRVLSNADHAAFSNTTSRSIWSNGARVINQTAKFARLPHRTQAAHTPARAVAIMAQLVPLPPCSTSPQMHWPSSGRIPAPRHSSHWLASPRAVGATRVARRTGRGAPARVEGHARAHMGGCRCLVDVVDARAEHIGDDVGYVRGDVGVAREAAACGGGPME